MLDFWANQRRARRNTVLYVFLFLAMTLFAGYMADTLLRQYAPQSYNPPLPLFGFLFVGIVCGVALLQYLRFRAQGGRAVAKAMGGRRVEENSADFLESRLLNIVREMALAAGVPTPPIYVFDAKQINAFAAGVTPENAAVAISRGALEKLNRSEVQAVIAHEIGHIANGDMRLGMRLAAMVMGFFFLLVLGTRLLYMGRFANIGQQRRQEANPILLGAMVLMMAGALTYVFGAILRASVSRQREYLADACSAQYTRHPESLASALRKIQKDSVQDMPVQGIALSHLYFNRRPLLAGLLATHPPISKRIAALVGEGWREEIQPFEKGNPSDTQAVRETR